MWSNVAPCGPPHQNPFLSCLKSTPVVFQILPNVRHGWLVQEITDQILLVRSIRFPLGTRILCLIPNTSRLQDALRAGVYQLCPRVDVASRESVSKALNAKSIESVRGWGVKNMDLLRDAVACGMHGATVNWPHEARDALEQGQ